jgi:formylglycine-generating enzyme required for sulfatase activity
MHSRQLKPHHRSMPRAAARYALAFIFTLLPYAAGADDPKDTAAPDKIQVVTNSIDMKLALIPAGKFLMGSPRSETERRSEEVQHEVVITKPFYLGVYEVTQREWLTVMGTKQRAVFDSARGGSPDHPMEDVLWPDAAGFCTKLSDQPEEKRAGRKYRLPTEAEWEYACRAGTTTAFHLGSKLSSQQANFNGSFPYGAVEKGPYVRKTAKVGSYKPSAFGLYDMHGNVAEWCSDWYDEDYYARSPAKDPLGPPMGVMSDDYGDFYKVVRGGSWLDDAAACRSASRLRAMRTNRYRLIGFRVACEVGTEKRGK